MGSFVNTSLCFQIGDFTLLKLSGSLRKSLSRAATGVIMQKYITNISMVLQTRPNALASRSIITFVLFIEFFFIISKHVNDKPTPKKSCENSLSRFIKRNKAKPKKVKGVKNLFKSHNSFQPYYV